ncbi:MAG TPA: phage tail protein [Solirubrobacteraceae bacterium]|jgi:phage protein U
MAATGGALAFELGTRPRAGMVKLVPSRGSALTMILDGPPDRGGGVGGWQSSERALRRPARWWQSQPEDTISLQCILDVDAIGGPSVERRLTVLYAMGQAGDEDEPPTLLLLGDVPVDGASRWVLQGITLSERLYQGDGSLRRQKLSVELEGYAPLPSIKPVAIKRTRDSKGKRRARTITTKKGDTLRAIAVRQLGQSDGWKRIRDWNPRRLKGVDPDAPLKAGIKVTLR